jgi:uncharacterized protein YuzE
MATIEVRKEQDSLFVDFSLNPHKVSVRSLQMVVDLDSERQTIGIEILNLLNQIGRRGLDLIECSSSTPRSLPRCSYDREVDAFYLRFSDQRSDDQRALVGCLYLDDSGRLTSLSLNLQRL